MDKLIIAITRKGSELALDLSLQLGFPCRIPRRFLDHSLDDRGYVISVGQLIQEAFSRYSALILIMAAGIAVRSIAPVLQDKRTDPAVVVLDEEGRYVISLLSGHLGGANRLAGEIAKLTGGVPVITTASDLNNLPSLDLIARQLQLQIEQPHLLPEVSGAIVNGERVVLWDRWGINEKWPENIRVITDAEPILNPGENVLVITGFQETPPVPPGTTVLALRPSCLAVGIGCCRGVPGVRIIGAIRRYFREHHWGTGSIKNIATIDVKSGEPGIIEACQEFKVPLLSYTRDELQAVMPGLNYSEFVEDTVGVGGVCEPAALLGAEHGRLIGSKVNLGQITLAVAITPDRSLW